MEETKPSAHLLYLNLSSFSEQYINNKILANNKFDKNTNIIKDYWKLFMKLKLITIIKFKHILKLY